MGAKKGMTAHNVRSCGVSESFTKALALLFATVFSLQINYTAGVLISKMIAFSAIIFFTTILHVKNIKLPHYLTSSLLLILQNNRCETGNDCA